jgi:hypothetical protein
MASPAPDDLARALRAHFALGMDAPAGDAEFNALALAVFAYQYDALPAYHEFCQRRGALPSRLRHWTEIPAVPAQAFKDVRLWCDDDGVTPPAAVFRTSGTTAEGRSGKHYMSASGLAHYDASLVPTFRAYVLPELVAGARSELALAALGPSPADAPHSSLWHMVDVAGRALFAAPARWYMDGEGGLDADGLHGALEAAARAGRGVCLFATDLALDRFVATLEARGARVALPAGSRVVRTGGAKGRRTALDPAALVARVQATLGVPAARCLSEYGMTELASQFYDDALARGVDAAVGERLFAGPPWLRATVVDVRTLEPLGPGQPGLLRHCDLANVGSALVVQTEDFGVLATDDALVGAGRAAAPPAGLRPFRLIGRATGSEARGCSLDAEEVPA